MLSFYTIHVCRFLTVNHVLQLPDQYETFLKQVVSLAITLLLTLTNSYTGVGSGWHNGIVLASGVSNPGSMPGTGNQR